MYTKIVGGPNSPEDNTPVEFAGTLKKCLVILAREAREAGFIVTADALLAQEDILLKELRGLTVTSVH
jgi:hypothetical protein